MTNIRSDLYYTAYLARKEDKMADTSVPMTSIVPDGGQLLNKPAHFVSSDYGCFLTIERPTLESSYVHIRGFRLDSGDVTGPEAVQKTKNNWQKIMQNKSKTDMVEVYIPWVKIGHIQNLIYKAK